MANVDIRRNQWRTAIMVVAPVVLLAALVTHPYLSGRLPNDAGVPRHATRWGDPIRGDG